MATATITQHTRKGVLTLSEITVVGPPEIAVRKDLSALALFAPAIASRVLAIAALRDVLGAFGAGLPPAREIEAAMLRDLDRLRDRQHRSGGWGFWAGDDPWPYLSVHVAHALARALQKGHGVAKHTVGSMDEYLAHVESHIPASTSPASRRAIVAYALYVLDLRGAPDPARARELIAEAGGVDRLPVEALGWIWPTLSRDPGSTKELAALRRHVQNQVTETAGAAHFATSYDDGAQVLLASDRRADGILLEALIADQPKSDLIPKLVAGLLAQRRAGRWASTQENAFVLLALDRYFAVYENATPAFVARAWLGDRFAGEHAFAGRTPDRHRIEIPMAALPAAGADLVLAKDGPGRLYYRVGLSYVPEGSLTPPVEAGFSVSRVYEPVDDPADVRRDAGGGSWRVKNGARVRVRLTMVAPWRRYHVALLAPLGGRLRLQLRGPGHHPGDLRRAASQGRGDVQPGDVREGGGRPGGRGVTRPEVCGKQRQRRLFENRAR